MMPLRKFVIIEVTNTCQEEVRLDLEPQARATSCNEILHANKRELHAP